MEIFKDSSVAVAIRVRPMNSREKALNSVEVVSPTGPQSVHMADDPSTKQEDVRDFGFDVVYPLTTTQDEVYDNAAKHVLDKIVQVRLVAL
jgi:hypothetical protein